MIVDLGKGLEQLLGLRMSKEFRMLLRKAFNIFNNPLKALLFKFSWVIPKRSTTNRLSAFVFPFRFQNRPCLTDRSDRPTAAKARADLCSPGAFEGSATHRQSCGAVGGLEPRRGALRWRNVGMFEGAWVLLVVWKRVQFLRNIQFSE